MKRAIAYMTKNRVAANLLMMLILLLGIPIFTQLPQEVIKSVSLDAVQVRVEYSGASPEEVEDGVVRWIEEEVEGIDGVDEILSVAAENEGIVTVQLKRGTDVSKAVDDVKAAVDRIGTFPEEAERPIVQEIITRSQVIQVAVYGKAEERVLKDVAQGIKDDLTDSSQISVANLRGVRNDEISIDVSEAALGAYGLQLSDVALAVRGSSLDLAGGSVETQQEEILIRSKGKKYTAREFEDIIVLTSPGDATVRLGDMAKVKDGFEDADLVTRFGGEPAAFVVVYRTGDERVLDIVAFVEKHLDTIRPSLPEGVAVDVWQNEARVLDSRLSLLMKNGATGLILVLVALLLFMQVQLAFWTAVGLFVSFVGGFIVMGWLGVSISLISLFAFIICLGIVVDDAIVIGENIYREFEEGVTPQLAAVRGTTRLLVPITFAILTTMTAFSPLFFLPGMMGKMMRDVPTIVIAVLAFSWIESLFILPAHLSHMRHRKEEKEPNFLERIQAVVARALKRFVAGPLDTVLRFCMHRDGLVLCGAAALFILTMGILASGFISFSFFPDVEGERVHARITMPLGTTASQTRRVTTFVEKKGYEAIAVLQASLPEDHPPLLRNSSQIIGEQPPAGPQVNSYDPIRLIQPHLAEVTFELLDAEARDISLEVVEEAWREKVGTIPGVTSLTFESALFSLGSSIEAELSAEAAGVLEEAAEEFKRALGQFGGVVNIADDWDAGKREVQLELLPEARSLGLTMADMSRQVRNAFFGVEAVRIQRGRDEVRVMVRLSKEERNALADIRQLRIRTPGGARVPLMDVAEARTGMSTASIERRNRRRLIRVTADHEDQAAADAVIASLQQNIIPDMERRYSGLRITFGGEQQEQQETLAALTRTFLIALFVIFACLAIPFRSYLQPLIIMSVIPFGFVGALFGHLLIGLDLTVLSLMGVIALSGVLVNDSIVMIDCINERRRAGLAVEEAIREGAKLRFRAIMLTTLTTFLGVSPLILERSLQAQFLRPMAVSLGLGIFFATGVLMILIPALMMRYHRIGAFFRARVLSRGE